MRTLRWADGLGAALEPRAKSRTLALYLILKQQRQELLDGHASFEVEPAQCWQQGGAPVPLMQ